MEGALIDFDVAVDASPVGFLDRPILDLGSQDCLAEVLQRQFVIELQDGGFLVDGRTKVVVNTAVRLKEVLDDVDVLAEHSVEVRLGSVVDADANAREELPGRRVEVEVQEDGLRWVLQLQLVPGAALRVVITGLVQIALILIALHLELRVIG